MGCPAGWCAPPGSGCAPTTRRSSAAVADYLDNLAPILAPRQVTGGGPILMVQVENEYGAYGQDPGYLRSLAALTRDAGIEVPLFTCDQADPGMLARGGVPELLRTATFGSRSLERLALLRQFQPTGPLMCMEFWNGWFDSWGLPHHVAPAQANARDLDDLLGAGASVNLYMFHGGTNFGFTNGANDKGTYLPITTSYDYDAPLSESGAPTPKYHAMRAVIAGHAPVPDELPTEAAPAPQLELDLDQHLTLWDALPYLGRVQDWDHLPTLDEAAPASHVMLYRAQVEPEDLVLSFDEVRDRALVFLDRDPVGQLSRTDQVHTVALPPRRGTVEILLEDQGRVNYGPRLGEAKGLMGTARTATREVMAWQATPLALDELDPDLLRRLRASRRTDPKDPVAGPVLVRATFDSVPGTDHFLRTAGWGRGLAWVNGFLLGRYSAATPTRTLYVPGPLVQQGTNELILLELLGAATATVAFVASPDLGPTES